MVNPGAIGICPNIVSIAATPKSKITVLHRLKNGRSCDYLIMAAHSDRAGYMALAEIIFSAYWDVLGQINPLVNSRNGAIYNYGIVAETAARWTILFIREHQSIKYEMPEMR
jgi:hypothetical protein